MTLRLAALPLMLLAFAAPACGGDDEEARRTPKPPELTVPGRTLTDDTAPDTSTGTAPEPPQSPGTDTGGGTCGGATSPPDPSRPDSPQNDVPPQPGTPEDRFERFCNENPGACGD